MVLAILENVTDQWLILCLVLLFNVIHRYLIFFKMKHVYLTVAITQLDY